MENGSPRISELDFSFATFEFGKVQPDLLKAALGLRPILQPEAKKLKCRLFKGLHFFVGSLAPHAELLTNIT